nr:ribonuclease Z [Candidatus Sigynarchaeota archaeon]
MTFLGTAASISGVNTRLPSIALQLDTGELLLFDTGEDVQRSYEEAKIRMNKPLTIFISHLHGDHVIGLPGLLFRMGLLNRTLDVNIYGPRGLFFYILAHRLVVGLKPPFNLTIHEIDLGSSTIATYPAFNDEFTFEQLEARIVNTPIEGGIIKRTKNYKVITLQADHTTPQNFSYIIKEEPRPGRFDPKRAQELGIPKGHLWGKMQNGAVITLKDGRTIDPKKESVIGPSREGRTVVISGDTRPYEAMITFLKNNPSSILIHEATYTSQLQHLAIERKHSTVEEACDVAKLGGVKLLILTHFSSRYLSDLETIETLAKAHFTPVIIARDQLSMEL